METSDAPQILEHATLSCPFTPFDCRWIPASARFIVFGQSPKAKGVFNVMQLTKGKIEILHQFEKEFGIKSGTFNASPISMRDVSVVDYKGKLLIYDIEYGKEKYRVQAHSSMANTIDGIGGSGPEYGAPELVTGGSDGCVRVWDPRQEAPVVSLEPAATENVVPDCWAVAFGNAYNSEERCIAAGYDNGDCKIFDLRTNCLRWDTNVKNGICGLQFDRPDIA
jgi:WD40 repeat protein